VQFGERIGVAFQLIDDVLDLSPQPKETGKVPGTDLRAGVGVRMKVETAVGPLRTSDLMEVIEWVESRTIGVRHTGLVRGSGRFELAPVAGGTRFTWTERLTFPWYLGGALTAIFAKPVLGWIWRRNLRGLKARIEG